MFTKSCYKCGDVLDREGDIDNAICYLCKKERHRYHSVKNMKYKKGPREETTLFIKHYEAKEEALKQKVPQNGEPSDLNI